MPQSPDVVQPGGVGTPQVRRSVNLPAVWLSDGVRPGLGFLSTEAAQGFDIPVEETGALFANQPAAHPG